MTRTAARPRVPRALAISAVLAALPTLVSYSVPAALSAPAAAPAPLVMANTQLEPLAWSELEGWGSDDHLAALATFQASCKVVLARAKAEQAPRRHKKVAARPPRPARPMRAALEQVCARAVAATAPTDVEAQQFFEQNFRPMQISKLGEHDGFLTGYYEPVVEGSRFPSDDYSVPLYRKPSNLVAARAYAKAGGFPNKGKVGRKFGRRHILPYYDRGEIEDGVLAGRGLEICWLKDPVDAFFLQIQGSARVRLDSGETLRLNYAAHNGLPYTPVGRVLIERGLVPREEMSMDRIRQWMEANPDAAKEVRRLNRSYVFMHAMDLPDGQEALGAEGIPLTPERSIAVDHALHVYGTPFFIAADLPIADAQPTTKFNHLMVAQDTGSAIVGPARADIYFGSGTDAPQIAGRLRHPGRFAMLVPLDIDPVAAAAHLPLPRPRPPLAEVKTAKNVVEKASSNSKSVSPAKGKPLNLLETKR